MDLNLLKTFHKVAELGSFTLAAKALKCPKSRVSRGISRLEEEMGTSLIKRTTRKTALTDSGKELFQKTRIHLEQLESQINSISQDTQEIKGTIRISTAEDFGQLMMQDLVSEFSKIYPSVRFDLTITNNTTDLTSENIDLALRIGKLRDSSLIQKRLGKVALVLVASPNYTKTFGQPTKLEEIKNHKLLSFKTDERGDHINAILKQKKLATKLTPDILCNSFPLLYKFALNGKGITLLPNFFCQNAISQGKLIRVLPEWSGEPSYIQIVYPPAKAMPNRTRVFIDFISERVKPLFDEL